jgi:hypothetical protein
MAPTVAKQRLPIEQRTKGYTVISQNITSWQPHAAEIVEYKPNLTCIQEHALGKQAEKQRGVSYADTGMPLVSAR